MEGGEPGKAYHVVTVDGVDGSVRIDGFTITDGRANGPGDFDRGGGMAILDASPAVVRVTFTENSAPGHGGGAMNIEGAAHPFVVNCQFLDNDGAEGGAIHSEGGSAGATLVNCLFAGNIASGIEEDHGGAIDHGITTGVMVVTNCTFTENTADDEGGAIFLHVGGEAVIWNSIFWNNSPDEIVEGDPDLATVNYSDVEGETAWPGIGNLNVDPLFEDAPNGDYRLQSISTVINKGDEDEDVIPDDFFDINNNGDDSEPTPDLDLGDRIVSAFVDMGAYESTACPWDLDGDCKVGLSDLLDLLAAWGPNSGHPADFDDDGFVGLSDLLALLANWDKCPCGTGPPPLSLPAEMATACLV